MDRKRARTISQEILRMELLKRLKLMTVEVTLECDWSSDVTPPEILSCSYRVNVSAVNVRRCL